MALFSESKITNALSSERFCNAIPRGDLPMIIQCIHIIICLRNKVLCANTVISLILSLDSDLNNI